ncbi:hypothetical protein HDU83_006323 [Entophlyctis luteolus]|nr:hypothetical protein HDU83_006323 [Entophlyctis luteolus]
MNFLRTSWASDSQGHEYAEGAIPELVDADAWTSTTSYGAWMGYAAGVGQALLASLPAVSSLKVPRALAFASTYLASAKNSSSNSSSSSNGGSDGVLGILGLARRDRGMVLPTTATARAAK